MVPLPYIDLRPKITTFLSGGLIKILFNFSDDPFTHIGKLMHIRKMEANKTFLNTAEDISFFATLPANIANLPKKVTLDVILGIKGSVDDHDMTKCYCPILRANMKKSIQSYFGNNDDEVQKLEKGISEIQNEIAELENSKKELESHPVITVEDKYTINLFEIMIDGRKKYLREYEKRLSHYKQIEKNKQLFYHELVSAPVKTEIVSELEYHKSHS